VDSLDQEMVDRSKIVRIDSLKAHSGRK
jgi:hypothetical protein